MCVLPEFSSKPTPAKAISKKNRFAKAKPLKKEAHSMEFDIDESEGAPLPSAPHTHPHTQRGPCRPTVGPCR